MTLQYTMKQRDGFLEVAPNAATDSADDIMAYVDEVLAQCRKLSFNRLLLDHRNLQFQKEHGGAYEVALECTKRMGDALNLHVAIVARTERMEFARIYETIGLTQGVLIKAFDEPAMAASWLTAN